MSLQSDPIWFAPICGVLLVALSAAASPGLRSVTHTPPPTTDPAAFDALLSARPDLQPQHIDQPEAEQSPRPDDRLVALETAPDNPEDRPDGTAVEPIDRDSPFPIDPEPLTASPSNNPAANLDLDPVADPTPLEEDNELDPPTNRCSFVANDVEVGRAIRRRRIASTDTPFESDGRPVFAWFDVTNRDRELEQTRVRWHHDETGHTFESTAPMRAGSHWQFYVESTLPPLMLGNWRVELLDASDCVVTTHTFELVPMGWLTAASAR